MALVDAVASVLVAVTAIVPLAFAAVHPVLVAAMLQLVAEETWVHVVPAV